MPGSVTISDNPTIGSINVNKIMEVYFWFFIITALLPLSFFVIWKVLSEWNKKREQTKYLLKGGKDPEDPDHKDPMLVSVIAPAYNEENSIGKCLESILNQDR
jgi:cellulose synthase/poly-beta-1,6-N-acetylglucosamine synthase-like glycosyltransferase